MDYYSEVVIQIETKTIKDLENVVESFNELEISEFTETNALKTYKYVTRQNEEIYTLLLQYPSVKWYTQFPMIKEFEKWFKKYSDIAEVGENTYGILSTQFQRIGDDDDDNEYHASGDAYNYLYLIRSVEIEIEQNGHTIEI